MLGVDPAHGDEAWRARLGVVLQSWRDHGKWRVRELLAHLGAYYAAYSTAGSPAPVGRRRADRRGRPDRARPASGSAPLSGGQRRRLDVAIGIVGRPELLFLDEPTAGFDPQARREFHDLVHRLADLDETTILLTTHDLDEAEKLADRILILAGGRIIADGSADAAVPPGRGPRPRSAGPATASGSCTPPRTPPRSSASCFAQYGDGDRRPRGAPGQPGGHLHDPGPASSSPAARDRRGEALAWSGS